MLSKTHAAAGFAAGFVASGGDPVSSLAAALASLLPDVESPGSFLGRRLPVVSRAANLAFGHRQALHSLLAAAGACAASFAVARTSGLPGDLSAAVLAGYASHLVLDSLNPAGVPWFWPLKARVRLPLAEVGGVLERLVLFPAVLFLDLYLAGRSLLPVLAGLLRKEVLSL